MDIDIAIWATVSELCYVDPSAHASKGRRARPSEQASTHVAIEGSRRTASDDERRERLGQANGELRKKAPDEAADDDPPPTVGVAEPTPDPRREQLHERKGRLDPPRHVAGRLEVLDGADLDEPLRQDLSACQLGLILRLRSS